MRSLSVASALLVILMLGLSFAPSPAAELQGPDATTVLSELFAEIAPGTAPSGVLYDRVLPLSALEELDGGVYAPTVSLARWRQAYHEIRRAADDTSALPALEELRNWPARITTVESIPIAILDYDYHLLREDAFEKGTARIAGKSLKLDEEALESAHVFAATALKETSYRGRELVFTFPPMLYFDNSNRNGESATRPTKILLDIDDGQGLRLVRDGQLSAKYNSPGLKELRLSAVYPDGTVRNAKFTFTVKALAAPAPDDTLQLTASILHDGGAASGEAYLYYAPGHSSVVQPVLLIEGFDLDDSMNWDEVYELLNTQNLLEDMRAAGYDLVVLNFDDATTEIQRNSMLVVELIQQVQEMVDPRAHFSMAGASMGGLCSRYALSYMETNGLPHRVNTWISFDAPHGGANIPLGLQYWLDFFSGESADAAYLLERLDRPAARQLLVYHHLASAGLADPLRGDFLADLASVGNYPSQPRRVAIANGSGSGQNQGFAPGQQIIRWEFNNILTSITGNVWAVGDGPVTRIFDGSITIVFIPIADQEISVGGTDPFDSAPGGSRSSMQQAGDTEAPYGDIIALHGSHCFIPTISALGLNTSDLFYDVDGDANLLALSPFDALYFPAANEEHVQVTAQNAQWIKDELFGSPTASEPIPFATEGVVLYQNVPNPFNPKTLVRFELGHPAELSLRVYDIAGRLVRTLEAGRPYGAGRHQVEWNGTDAAGRSVASGVYILRIDDGQSQAMNRMTLLK